MEDFEENTSHEIISYFENNYHETVNNDIFFETFNKNFPFDEITILFNYILKNKIDSKLINYVIKQINKEKRFENLSCLLDFILRPISKESFLDLKVIAIKTISNFKDKTSVQALLYCLNDKNSNYKIRLASAEALGKIGDTTAFESLGRIASDDSEKSVYVRESAASALGMLGDNRALDIFESIINTKQMFLDKFSYLKERIIEAMSKLDIEEDKKAHEILKTSILDKSENVRIAAIEAIMNSNIDNAYEIIYERLINDDSMEVKKNSLIALYNISDENILYEVINSDDYSDELKDYAKEIIKESEDDQ